METSIFRKSALEKMSSPEQLNDYIKLIRPSSWYVLAGLLVIVTAAMIWAFAGTIPERVSVKCVVFSETDETAVYAYLPLAAAKRLSENMQVQVSPDWAPREEFGYIYGTLSSIGSDIINESDLINRYGSVSYAAGILPPESEGNFVEIRILLQKNEGGLSWSNPKGNAITLENGAYCTGIIITSERRPYELFFK